VTRNEGDGRRAVIPLRDRLTVAQPAKAGATPASVTSSLGAARRRRQVTAWTAAELSAQIAEREAAHGCG
jgi:hypothetical protein